jgi:hypothetical protein
MPSDDLILVDYLRRAYHAVDGLWFMKVEQAHDFAHALELDRQVWQVLAKIQARKARELLGCTGDGAEELARCFSLKLMADGHRFAVAVTDDGVRFTIQACPWLELLRKSGREQLAARIARTICPIEGEAWCAEFAGEYRFSVSPMGCAGSATCVLHFMRRS